MDNLTDQQLLERLGAGDSGALTHLYKRYADRIFKYCQRLLGDGEAAGDAVQNTFLKLQKGTNGLAQPASFQSWLFRIARNEALMLIRHQHATTEIQDDDVWDEETPLEKLMTMETTQIVQTALAALKIEYREVLMLREYEQLSYTEIASITGATESSVRSRLSKARKALAVKLEPFLKVRRVL